MKRELTSHWWIGNLLRPVLIAAMMVCLATPLVWGMEWLFGDWDGTYFLVFFFLAGLEGVLSERILRKQRIDGYEYLGSRAAEVVVLLLLLKVASYIPQGMDRLWADAQSWSSIEQAVGSVDLVTAAVFVPLWAGAILVSRRALELDLDEARTAPPPDKTSTAYYLWLTQPPLVREREQALNWLGETFMWGGVLLLVGSAVISGLLPMAGVLAIPTLLYFALGIAMLSQARFSVMSTSWRVQGIVVQPGITRRWLLWAAVFLVGIALVARVLPTHYTLGPLLALYYLIMLVVQGVTALVALIAYALALLVSLFMPSIEPPPAPSVGLPMPPAVEPTAPTSLLPWLETLLSVLFWAVILVIVGYAVFRFLRDRLSLEEGDREAQGTWWGRFLAWLRDLWRNWWAGWRRAQAELGRRLTRHREAAAIAARLFRPFSLRRLAPRDLVRYFYLSAVRRAAEAGQARSPGQTPYEYEADLGGHFPDLEPDLGALTEGFVGARYSQRPVHREDAEAVKGPWQRLKAALRRRRVAPP